MAIGTAADLDFVLLDGGSPVVFGAQSTNGILSRQGTTAQDESGLTLLLTETHLLVRTGTLTGIKADVAITVGGAAYTVRHSELVGDGQITRLILAEA